MNAKSPVVLQHVVGLTLGPAVDLTSSLPAPNLEQALCRNSVLPTLNKRRGSYWSEINPILQRWQNDFHIRPANVSSAALFRAARRGLRRSYMGKITWRRYTDSQRDVVTHTMSVYASLALNGTDDVLSSIRGARPVRPYGWISHWHGRPARSSIMIMSSLLDQNSGVSGVSSALQSGRLFVPTLTTHFREVGDVILPSAAVRFVRIFTTLLRVRDENSPVDQPGGIPVMSLPPPLTFTASTPTVPVIQRPMRSLTPNNGSLKFLQTSPGEDVQVHNIQHRGAVASISIASTDLLLHVGPLPMEQLILHDTATVCDWPHGARGELFAVARRDIAVARRNLARMTQYVDLQDDHLAACDGALDDGIPLMTVEMFSRPTGGIQSVLDVVNRQK